MALHDIITNLKQNWSTPRRTADSDRSEPDLEVACSFAERGVRDTPDNIPTDLEQFWQTCATARLFEDRQFGQWGLEIWDPAASDRHSAEYKHSRLRDFKHGDRVIGRFLGDSDLLLIRCDSSVSDFETIFVILPLDPRSEWKNVGRTLTEFLQRYVEAEGSKFWEQSQGRSGL